jgi:hypothetical protein
MKEPSSTYWAAETDPDKLGGELIERIEEYYKYLLTYNYMGRWSRIYKSYYVGQSRDDRLNSGGDQGQYTIGNVNHLHSIIRRILVLTITQRPAFQPRATNSDVKSQRQTILANQLLDYYTRVKRAEKDLFQATEFACLFGEGFVHVCWDTASGDLAGYLNAKTGEPATPDDVMELQSHELHAVHDGDIRITAAEPIDVIRDVRLENFRSRDWIIVREYMNKYNVAAKYPEYHDEITSMEISTMSIKNNYRQKVLPSYSTDQIPVYTFYHAKTPAVPKGAFAVLLENGTLLQNGTLPYKHLPVYRIVAEDRIGTPFGNSPANDLLPLQEAYDMEFSTVLTNHNAFGVQNIMVPKGSGMSVTQMEGGLNLVEYDHNIGKPEPLNLLSTPPEVFNFMGSIEQNMEMVSGVNSTVRGNPQAGLGKDSSGAAMALVQSQAIEFNSPLQMSYAQLLEDFGTGVIQIIQDYAKTKRIMSIAGKSGRSDVVEFTGTDLANIERVVVETGNPLAKTVEGKMQIAQMLLQAQIIKHPDELLQVIQTGNLDPMIEGKTSELMNIQAENEELSNGQSVQAILTDEHLLHISEHKSVLADPSARKNPTITKASLDHINQHLNILKNPDNAQILQLLGQPSLSSPPPQGGAPGNPASPGQGAPNPISGGQQPPPPNNGIKQPGLPEAPKNPMNGQHAPVAPGTAVRGH